MELVVYEYGVDIDRSFSFIDGDLRLVEYNENIVQAMYNRLNTDLDELDLFYEDYGSVLLGFCGWRRVNETLQYIKLEVDNCLKKDPRLSFFNSEVKFNELGEVVISITLYPAVLNVNFVLNDEGLNIINDEEV